jgi:hypothetical protein
LRTSTTRRRVHSLFRQGYLLYEVVPNLPEDRLPPLIDKYTELGEKKRPLHTNFRPRLK